MNNFRAGLKLAGFVLLSALIVPTQSLFLVFYKGNAAYILPRLWHKGICFIFGIKYEIAGTPCTDKQTLFMSNHLSYLDIPVLGAAIKNTSFLAKSDVAKWPIFGFLSKLQQTAFIERKVHAIKKETDALQSRVSKKQNLIIFPEGTSGDGFEVLPFKSSLFTLAQSPDLYIQPVTITLLTTDHKVPSTLEQRRLYTWPREDDIEMPTHLWRFMKTKGARLRLTFHPPFHAAPDDDRKTLAKRCHDSVSRSLNI